MIAEGRVTNRDRELLGAVASGDLTWSGLELCDADEPLRHAEVVNLRSIEAAGYVDLSWPSPSLTDAGRALLAERPVRVGRPNPAVLAVAIVALLAAVVVLALIVAVAW